MGSGTPFSEFSDESETRERSHRARRMLVVELRGRRFGSASATIRDISSGGLGGTSSRWLVIGEPVELTLPNFGTLTGSVIWTEGNRFGLAFDEAIDASRVTRETSPGMDRHFEVMDRFRPETSMKRPPIGRR